MVQKTTRLEQMTVIASLRALGRPFPLMWAGQTISMVSSAIAGFAFGVWIFQDSGKVLDFAGMAVIGALPGLLITPWAGSVADRLDRRYVILASNVTRQEVHKGIARLASWARSALSSA